MHLSARAADNNLKPGPFSREHDRNPLPFRVPLVFSIFLSLNLVYSALRKSTRAFFRSLISCIRMANLRETKKASPYNYARPTQDPHGCCRAEFFIPNRTRAPKLLWYWARVGVQTRVHISHSRHEQNRTRGTQSVRSEQHWWDPVTSWWLSLCH